MNKLFALIGISVLIIASNVAAADLAGTWVGTMECISGFEGPNADVSTESEDFEVEIFQNGNFFLSYNYDQPDGVPPEVCGGIIDGKKISMSCPRMWTGPEPNDFRVSSFAYGEIKKDTLSVISHVPDEGKTCKGTATRISD